MSNIDAALPALPNEARSDAAFSERELTELHATSLSRLVRSALHDDVVLEEEDRALTRFVDGLGLHNLESDPRMAPLLAELAIARVNAGRMPEIEPTMILRRGELMHAEFSAVLLKEVAIRERRGNYGGVSFRVAKGVRFHTGQIRGRSVVVGAELVAEDTGSLAITSTRSVFRGQKSTIEVRHDRLIDLGVFTDGVRFHVTNRKSAPLFRVESGELVAAIVNGAVQRLD